MSENGQSQTPARPEGGELPTKVLLIMVVVGAGAMLFGTLGKSAILPALTVILTDGLMALMVLISAAGYGWGLYRLLAPRGAPPLLALATAAGGGLALLSLAVFVVGSLAGGALTMAVWWPVLGGGVALALIQSHRPLGGLRLPRTLTGYSLVWVVAAAGVSLWLSGALMPAGWLGNLSGPSGDAAAVLARHMQLPREFYQAGRVAALPHNVYSHFPLGTEMLRLLGMCLRGGAYEGMYLAKLIVGLYAVVAVAGAFGGLRPAGRFHAAAGAALLATAPWVLYLSWLALPELASLAYLVLALVWVRHWLARPGVRPAACIGLMLAAAATTDYAAAATVAAPVLVVVAVGVLFRRRGLGQLFLAGGLVMALLLPWLIRNAVATGNPVFPLATGVFGRGRWSDEVERRWQSAHGGAGRPVPQSPDAPPDARPTRGARAAAFFLGPVNTTRILGGRHVPLHTVLGPVVLLVLAGTVVAMLLRPRAAPGWDWLLLAVAVLQLAGWLAFGAGAAGRVVAPAVGPICLLCASGLGRLAGVRKIRWLRQSPAAGGRWGLAPATLLLIAAAVLNIAAARSYWAAEMGRSRLRPAGLPARRYAEVALEFRAAHAVVGDGKLALVGDDRPFYHPPGTLYATAFDEHPLAGLIGRSRWPEALADGLRRRGITHLYVAWARIDHLARTAGWPTSMSPIRLKRILADWPVVEKFQFAAPTASAPASAPASGPASAPASRPASTQPTQPAPGGKVLFTLYAVPPPTPATTTAPTTTIAPTTGPRPVNEHAGHNH